MINNTMANQLPFFQEPEWTSIVDNINGIYTSDGTITTLLDFERVLDEADLYAFKNWDLGELVDGPNTKRYTVDCTFMWPYKLMPDPRGAKRLLTLGCQVKFKTTEIDLPMKVDKPTDFKSGTHYPKLQPKKMWLVHIVMPKQLLNDIKEGSIDLADQTIDLSDLDDAYAEDLQKEQGDDVESKSQQNPGLTPDLGGIGGPPGIGGLGGQPAGAGPAAGGGF
jgi:hypothetical protein